MEPIPSSALLKSEDLIERWRLLAQHARRTPSRPSAMAYIDLSGMCVTSHRDSGDPSIVHFVCASREDLGIVGDLAPSPVVTVDYTLSESVPFVIRQAVATPMHGAPEEPDRDRSLWAHEAGLLQVSVLNFDELLLHLASVRPQVLVGALGTE